VRIRLKSLPNIKKEFDLQTKNSSAKNNIVICFENSRFLLSYCNAESLVKLKLKYNLTFIISEKISAEESFFLLDYGKVYRFNEIKFLKKITNLVLARKTYLNRYKSKSFETRIRHLYPEIFFTSNKLLDYRKISVFYIKIKKENVALKSIEQKILKYSTNINKFINSDTSTKHFIILSGGAYSGFETSAISFANQNKINTVLVIDNWDNLSSKSILLAEPKIAVVWGDFMEKEARVIHSFNKTRIYQLTPLRFNYEAKINRHINASKYVLFAGSGGNTENEMELLKKCATIFQNYLTNVDLLYRPHPTTISNYSRFIQEFNSTFNGYINVKIDSSLNELSKNNWYSINDQKRVSDLIVNCEFLITPHSTMLLEANFRGKPAVALSYDILSTSESQSRERNDWNEYQHLIDYRKNPYLILVENEGELARSIMSAIAMQDSSVQIKQSCKEFIVDNSSDFYGDIFKIIDKDQSL
jgi:hypothetical protein